jgi:hypothetical protein
MNGRGAKHRPMVYNGRCVVEEAQQLEGELRK